MKSEISLEQWRSNLEVQSRFANFWSNVSSVQVASSVRDDTSRAIIEAMGKVDSRKAAQ